MAHETNGEDLFAKKLRYDGPRNERRRSLCQKAALKDRMSTHSVSGSDMSSGKKMVEPNRWKENNAARSSDRNTRAAFSGRRENSGYELQRYLSVSSLLFKLFSCSLLRLPKSHPSAVPLGVWTLGVMMGQALSCRETQEHELFGAVQLGDLETVGALLEEEPALIHQTTVYDRLYALHIAAENGQIEVLSFLLERSDNPDVLNRHKQTPLMLAAMHGNISCVQKLLQAGANILMFDSLHGRTCLHHAAYYGHSDCLQAILSAAHSTPVAESWGFARFVNIRDGNGATPLHLAARQRRPNCVHVLLDNGGLVCACTGGYGSRGSTPLHLAARGGCIDSIRELLAWGADRLQRDSSGRIPYIVALKHKHGACAALLNPSSAEPLVWPSPLKFISELNPDAKILLERALMEANREREKTILKGTAYVLPSPVHSESGIDDDIDEASNTELCCICFDQVCTIEVQNCGHQMCAPCTLALCCHNKPDPTTACLTAPVCPFCRSSIAQLVVAQIKNNIIDNPSKLRKSRRSMNLSEGSSSFKGLSAIGSFGRIGGRGSGRINDISDLVDK